MPDVGSILRDFDIPWPAANEDDLREAATIWHGLADVIRDNYQHANNACIAITSNNEGAAVRAFEDYWHKFGASSGALPRAAEACDTMGNACTKYADEVAAAKSKLEEAGIEIGATLALGTFGAVFTLGISEGTADAAAAGLLYAAESAITNLGSTAAAVATELSAGVVAEAITAAAAAIGSALTADGVVAAVASGIFVVSNGVISGGTSAILAASADNAVRQLFGDAPLSRGEAVKDLLEGAGTGALGGVLGKLSELGQPQLANLLRNAAKGVSDFDMQLSAQMVELARQVEGTSGKIATEILSKAATQLVTAQQIDAAKIVEGEIPKLLTRGITTTGDTGNDNKG